MFSVFFIPHRLFGICFSSMDVHKEDPIQVLLEFLLVYQEQHKIFEKDSPDPENYKPNIWVNFS